MCGSPTRFLLTDFPSGAFFIDTHIKVFSIANVVRGSDYK